MIDHKTPDADVAGTAMNTRIVLAMLWVCHFILWIFGDMFTLLQGLGEPATDTIIQFVAPTTAIVLVLTVVVSLLASAKRARMTNLIAAPVYLAFNIGFFIDASEGWEYYLGFFYVVFNALIIWQAYAWRAGREKRSTHPQQ